MSDGSSSCSSLAVIANVHLWRQVASFMPGLPHGLLAFYHHQVAMLSHSEKERLISSHPQEGAVAKLAMACKNWRVLALLTRLHEISPQTYSTNAKLLLADAALWAVHSGNIEALEWLLANCMRVLVVDPWLMDYAVSQCQLGIAQWLCVHQPKWCVHQRDHWIDRAVEKHDVALLQWVSSHVEYTFGPEALVFAARSGRVANMQCVVATRNETAATIKPKVMVEAATHGHLEMVMYLCEQLRVNCSPNAMDRAARHGHFHIVQYLHSQPHLSGCTSRAMNNAAGNGHLDIVKFLHENRTEGCTLCAMDDAASNGHLAVVEFLHANRHEGCSVHAMDNAAAHGHLNVVMFLHEHRHEGCTTWAMDRAASNGHLDLVKFLHTNRQEGCTVYAMQMAAANGRLDIVKFLHEQREEGCTSLAMDLAARCGHLTVVRFLYEHRTEGCSDQALKNAMENGHDEIVSFLQQSRLSRPFR